MPNNPLTQAELTAYTSNTLYPQIPAGYFFASPPTGAGPLAYRLFDASYISIGIINPNRLGTGSTGAGNLYLADDGTWKSITVATPTLAQVTTAGNTTTNAITVGGLTVNTNLIYTDTVNSRVGIGTVTPDRPLHINSVGTTGLRIDVTGAGSNAIFLGAASSLIRWSNGSYFSNTGMYSGTNDQQYITFDGTNTQVRLQIKASNGNIGINTTTDAGYKLDVNGTARVTSNVIIDGSLGIGTNNPAARYHQYQGQGIMARYDISTANANQNRGVWDFYTNAAVAPDFFGRFGFKFEGGITDSFKQFQLHIADSVIPKMVVTGGGLLGLGTVAPTYKVDVQGTTLATSSVRVQGSFDVNPLAAPPAIGGFTLSAGTNLGVGTYYYFVTYVTALGETNASSTLTVTTTTGNTTVNLTGIPVSSDSRVTARKIYRTLVGQTFDAQRFLATINDNVTTTYTDSATDASLTGAALQYYKVNTTARYFTITGTQGMILDYNLTALGRNAGAAIISSNGASVRTVLVGADAGKSITTGQANVIVGVAGLEITTGGSNTLMGDLAGRNINTGYGNTIIGSQTGRFLTSGYRNTFIGENAGSYLADGTTQVTTAFHNIAVGRNTRLSTINDSYSIIIGDTALGLGSNSTVIGNSSTTFTSIPAGNMTVGGTTNAGYRLDVQGQGYFSSGIVTNTAVAIKLIASGGILNDATEFRTGAGEFKIFSGRVSGAHQALVFATGDNYTSGATRMVITSGGNVGIGTTSPTYKLDIQGTTATSGISTDIGLNLNPVTNPSTGSVSLIASAGNVDLGTHHYWVSYTTAVGETGTYNIGNVTTVPGSQQVLLTIPVSSDYRVTGRKLHRTKANGFSYETYVITTIANNTATTYIDNIADSALTGVLSAGYYQINTTNKGISVQGGNVMSIDRFATHFGINAGGSINGGGNNTLIGYNAGRYISTGNQNVGVGTALGSLTTGGNNVAMGSSAASSITTGSDNIMIGRNAAVNINGSSNQNTIVGNFSWNAGTPSAKQNNTGLGFYVGSTNTGNNNLFLGFYAGYYVTGSNNILLDTLSRADEATSKSAALIYGVTNATASSQTLSLGGGGNVMIGTLTNAGYKLDVNGTTRIQSNLTVSSDIIVGTDNITNAWIAYTPIWSSQGGTQPNLGDGTLTGFYKKIGKTVFVRVKLNFGLTTTGGDGAWLFSLPVNAASQDGIQFPCSMLDNGFAWYQGIVNGTYSGFTDKSAIIAQSPGGANSSQGVSGAFPFGWGNGDSLQFNGSYECI